MLTDIVQRQAIALASLNSEKSGLEQRRADRVAEVAALSPQPDAASELLEEI